MSGTPRSANQSGTQAIQRATFMLRLLTRRGLEGWRLSELTKASGLTHPTARRILKCLSDENLVERDAGSGRYRLGPLNFELGLACGNRLEFRGRLRPAIERIAQLTSDTVYLHIRSGLETVCIDRVDGSFPIRAVTLEIGGRRPLGFGSAGLAILAGLTDGEVEQILSGLHRDIAANPRVTRESLLKAVSQTRAQGYGMIHHTTVMGVGAIGIVVPERPGLPLLGVGVAMVSERLSQARARTIHRIMTEELATV